MENTLKQKLAAGAQPIGTFFDTASVSLMECLGRTLGVFTKKIFRKSFVFSVGEIRNYKLESETDRGEDPLAACGRMRGSHGEQ